MAAPLLVEVGVDILVPPALLQLLRGPEFIFRVKQIDKRADAAVVARFSPGIHDAKPQVSVHGVGEEFHQWRSSGIRPRRDKHPISFFLETPGRAAHKIGKDILHALRRVFELRDPLNLQVFEIAGAALRDFRVLWQIGFDGVLGIGRQVALIV